MKKIYKMLKNIKKRFFKNNVDIVFNLNEKYNDLNKRVSAIEKENLELKLVIENLSIAYLDLAKSIIQTAPPQNSEKYSSDDYLDQMLKLFNSEQNDDDLIN